MRFPLSLTLSMGSYVIKKRLHREKHFPLVLMLEPLFACNLHCTGCGRIREYASEISRRMTLEECLSAVDECGAPIISICGGEPLLYPEITSLAEQLTQQRKKHVYLCTNGLLLKEKIREFGKNKRLFINVHLDGMESTHDASTGHAGTFSAAISGIQEALKQGFRVCTNTTVYKESQVDELVELCRMLNSMGVSELMLAPAYSYEVITQIGDVPDTSLFLHREETYEKFRALETRLKKLRLVTTPLYMDLLTGRRYFPCAAWANPTRNVCGWKGPCYLITDKHYATYKELLSETNWEDLGPGKDVRCKDCMMHCGFEPGAVMEANRSLWQSLRLAWWQMW